VTFVAKTAKEETFSQFLKKNCKHQIKARCHYKVHGLIGGAFIPHFPVVFY
jgi:hypothetical protein